MPDRTPQAASPGPDPHGDAARHVRSAARDARVVETLSETFRALGDPTRLRIAITLSDQEMSVTQLAERLVMSQSAVSHSLRALRQLRLVRVRRAGRTVYYGLDDDHIVHLLDQGVRHVEEAP